YCARTGGAAGCRSHQTDRDERLFARLSPGLPLAVVADARSGRLARGSPAHGGYRRHRLLPTPRAGGYREQDPLPGWREKPVAATQIPAISRLDPRAWTTIDGRRGTGGAVGDGDDPAQSAGARDVQLFAGTGHHQLQHMHALVARGILAVRVPLLGRGV